MESHHQNPLSQERRILLCCSIVANALCAGGIFMFPIFSPGLLSKFTLTQPQLTTIVLAGMVGQYPLSAFVGKVIDIYGPFACSLLASGFFAFAFGSISFAFSRDNAISPSTAFQQLTFAFFIAGLGTVTSYFSSLFAASLTFPNHVGFASGTTMALFSLSPLCLSLVATRFFTDSATDTLDLAAFLKFLAILTGIVHAGGAINLRATPRPHKALPIHVEADGEREPLLASPKGRIVNPLKSIDEESSALALFRDSSFWILVAFCFVTLGTAEMVISNVGTMVLSLPSLPTRNLVGELLATDATSSQVRILSVSNTVTRVLVGPIADLISPPPASGSSAGTTFPGRRYISRVIFLAFPALILASSFLWMEIGSPSQKSIWILSCGVGVAYGAIFTVLPSIISSMWGVPNLGRNFGIVTYAPFLGTPLFSYLYAFVSASHSEGSGPCQGTLCWRETFWVSFVACLCAFGGTLVLWRRWGNRL